MIPVVLYGQTGCGKTRLLKVLSSRGFPVLDLEFLANHRGSAFGQLNVHGPQPSQQQFERSIETIFADAGFSKFIFLEFESSNLGKLKIPEKVLSMYKEGIPVLLKADVHQRVHFIVEEYLPADKFLLIKSLDKLKHRIESGEKSTISFDSDEKLKLSRETDDKSMFNSTLDNNLKFRSAKENKFLQLKNLLESEQYKEFCYIILEYYDNSRNYNLPNKYELVLDNLEINVNADKLLSWVNARYVTPGFT